MPISCAFSIASYRTPMKVIVITIPNSNFELPDIPNNTSLNMASATTTQQQQFIWSFGNFPILVDKQNFPTPFPSGGQCVVFAFTATIYTTLNIPVTKTYKISLYVCKRTNLNYNPLKVIINGVTIYTVSEPSTYDWTYYEFTTTINAGTITLQFQPQLNNNYQVGLDSVQIR